ncbi:MAG: hypothetical protein KF760_14840 [Candidatus Eremiobacteraeota bacterium]|nr:hypothetical protein [Candidatus Eremiobacteraeota bacterium]MCW5869827.1 hypothetical protein [Candidatus Eremiobacteraeota bacterium]
MAESEAPFEVVVNGQVRERGVFDRFHHDVEIRELLDGPVFSSKCDKFYPRQTPPPFHFAAVVSDRRRYPVGSRVYLIHRLEKGLEYRQCLRRDLRNTLYERSLVADQEWYVQCLEDLEPGRYEAQLIQGRQISQACFQVLPLGPPRAPAIPYRVVHHYPESLWEKLRSDHDDPFGGSPLFPYQEPCQVEIEAEGTLEYYRHDRLENSQDGAPKFVPGEFFAQYSHYIPRHLILRQGERSTALWPEEQSRPIYLGGDHYAGKVAWPGAEPVDGLFFSGSLGSSVVSPRATGLCDQGPWLISYALVEDQESFRFHPPAPVKLQLKRSGSELELASPLAGEALLVLSDPESAGASLMEPYAQTLFSWLKAATFSCQEGALQEEEVQATGNVLFLIGQDKPPEVTFNWGDPHEQVSKTAEPVELQEVRPVVLTPGEPVRVPLPREGPGRARLYLFAAGRLHLEELSW